MKTNQFAAIYFSISLLGDWTAQPKIIHDIIIILTAVSFIGGLIEGRKEK